MIGKNEKIERLMYAIMRKEGWFYVGHPQYPNGSIAYRHNNPGNLRKSPFEVANVKGYSVFRNENDGIYALYWDIWQKSMGNTKTGLNGGSTLRAFVYVWAPPTDSNLTEKYLKDICQWSGLDESTRLDSLFE